jgi:lipopolysaccharide biosynthesis glycosyltransferase
VTALDKKFINPVSVMLMSLDQVMTEKKELHVVCSKFDIDIVKVALSNLELNKISLNFLTVDIDAIIKKYPSISMQNILHFSNAALYRLFLGSLLSDSYTRFVYLDGDLLIRGNIDVLLNCNQIFAAVRDSEDSATNNFHFNSGVIIADLGFWRRNNVESKLMEFLTSNPNSIYKDQDALNFVFKDSNVLLLNKIYNFIPKDNSEIIKSSDPVIVHFAGHLKPWLRSSPNNRFVREWRSLAKKNNIELTTNFFFYDYLLRILYATKLDHSISAIKRNFFIRNILNIFSKI